MLNLATNRKPNHDAFLRAEARKMLTILASPTSLIEKLALASDTVVAGIANRLDFSRARSMESNRHLAAVLERATMVEGILIDIEGSILGNMVDPADLVYYKDGVIFLEDMTSDESMVPTKTIKLRALASSLSLLFTKDVYSAMAVKFSVWPPIVVTPNRALTYLSEFERFQFELVDALAESSRNPLALGDSIFRARFEMPDEPIARNTVPPSYAVEIASGCTDPVKVATFIKECTMYPKSMAYVRSLFSTETSFVRGFVGLTSESVAITTSDGEAGFFLRLKDTSDDTIMRMAPGGRVVAMDEPIEEACLEVKHKGGGYFEMKVLVSAAKRYVDLAKRKGGSGKHGYEFYEMTPEDTGLAYSSAEEVLATYEAPSSVNCPDLLDRAKAILETAPGSAGASKTIREAASKVLEGCTSTVASSMFAVARVMHDLSLHSSYRTSEDLFHVSTAAAGKIVQITKCTGPLETSNDTSCVTFVSNPTSCRGTWFDEEVKGIAISKALFIRSDTTDWMSEAPGVVSAIVGSYMENLMDPSASNKSYIAAVNLLALSNRKTLNVALQMERHMIVGSASLANELDNSVDKLSVTTPITDFEKVLLFRLVIRGIACATIRDTGSLVESVKEAPDGRKTSIYCPLFAREGLMSMPGLVNCFYDGTLSSGSSASKIRAVGVATMGLFEGTDVYETRKKTSDEMAWMASAETVEAWKAGRLSEYIDTDQFLQTETRYALSIIRKKYCCCLALKYYEAVACKPSIDINDLSYRAAQASMVSTLTLKKGLDDTRLTEDKCSFPSFVTNTVPFVKKFVGADREVSSATLSFLENGEGADKLASIGSIAARSFTKRSSIIGYATDKSDSIEKPRDIVFLNFGGRGLQKFVDSVGYDTAKETGRSVLKHPDKIAYMIDAKKEVTMKDNVTLSFMTDRSTYGPSMTPSGFYATYVAFGATGEFRDIVKHACNELTKKRVRLHDILMAEDADLRALDGLAGLVEKAKLNPDWTLPSTIGMFQGIFQGTADMCSSVIHAYEERCLLKLFSRAKSFGTNDDGLGYVSVKPGDVWASSIKIFTILLMCSHTMGEALNTSKTVISSTVSDLNTQLLINDQPFLPYVRSLASSAMASSEMTTVSSALAVISSSNQAIKEGAPAFLIIMALAVAWAVHYEKFRVIEKAVKGEYISVDPLYLGPPVFEPCSAMLAGPWATSIASMDLTSDEVKARIYSRVASVCSTGQSDNLMTKWASPLFQNNSFEGPCSYDIVLRLARLGRKSRTSCLSERIGLPLL